MLALWQLYVSWWHYERPPPNTWQRAIYCWTTQSCLMQPMNCNTSHNVRFINAKSINNHTCTLKKNCFVHHVMFWLYNIFAIVNTCVTWHTNIGRWPSSAVAILLTYIKCFCGQCKFNEANATPITVTLVLILWHFYYFLEINTHILWK